MDKKEAILRIKDHMEHHKIGEYPNIKLAEALDMALTALRPASREKVEKVWKGEWKLIGAGKTGRGGIWYCTRCEKCYPYTCDFCPRCGAPITDEAVEMVMRRLEAMHGEV